MLFQLKKLPEIINLTRFLKSFWILYIDQIIVYSAFYSMLTFYIIKDRCQMHTLKNFRSPVWLLLHKLSSPHYRYVRKMRRGYRLPLTQTCIFFSFELNNGSRIPKEKIEQHYISPFLCIYLSLLATNYFAFMHHFIFFKVKLYKKNLLLKKYQFTELDQILLIVSKRDWDL